MTPREHKKEAERLLGMVWKKDAEGKNEFGETSRREILDKARVHAMLANEPRYLMSEEP